MGLGMLLTAKPFTVVIQRDLTPPVVDDGLLEVVGFKDAWHGTVLLAKGHGVRLSQVCCTEIYQPAGPCFL